MIMTCSLLMQEAKMLIITRQRLERTLYHAMVRRHQRSCQHRRPRGSTSRVYSSVSIPQWRGHLHAVARRSLAGRTRRAPGHRCRRGGPAIYCCQHCSGGFRLIDLLLLSISLRATRQPLSYVVRQVAAKEIDLVADEKHTTDSFKVTACAA